MFYLGWHFLVVVASAASDAADAAFAIDCRCFYCCCWTYCFLSIVLCHHTTHIVNRTYAHTHTTETIIYVIPKKRRRKSMEQWLWIYCKFDKCDNKRFEGKSKNTNFLLIVQQHTTHNRQHNITCSFLSIVEFYSFTVLSFCFYPSFIFYHFCSLSLCLLLYINHIHLSYPLLHLQQFACVEFGSFNYRTILVLLLVFLCHQF